MKAKLPKIDLKPVPDAQKLHLRRWLAEFRLEQHLRGVDDEEAPALAVAEDDGGRGAVWSAPLWPRPDFSTEPLPAVGQIRLASPALFGRNDRPVFIAILADWPSQLLLVAPYSPFSAPAETGELLTQRTEDALRVLSLWNARGAPRFFLARSWLVDQLSAKELTDALAVFRHKANGNPVPRHLVDRVGPPVFKPLDPRLMYQEEQADLLEPLTQATMTVVSRTTMGWAPDVAARREFLLAAAEPGVSPARRSLYRVRETSCRVSVNLHSDFLTCGVLVVDEQGEISTALDGCVLCSDAGRPSPPFHRGQSTARLDDLMHGFYLVDPAGLPLTLEDADE